LDFTDEDPFEEAQARLSDTLSQVVANADVIADLITAENLSGEIGLTRPLFENQTDEEVENEIRRIGNQVIHVVESSDNYPEVVSRLSELYDEELGDLADSDQTESQETLPQLIAEQLGHARAMLNGLGEVSEVDFYDSANQFMNELDRQEQFQNATSVLLLYFIESPPAAKQYVNSYLTRLPGLIDRLEQLEEDENPKTSELVELYRECSILYENALPPVTILIDYLDDGSVNIESSTSKRLSNGLRQLDSFGYLGEFAEPLNPKIRNALGHGGTSGYSRDRVNEQIIFRYQVGDSLKEMKISRHEFCDRVVKVACGAASLYVLPLFLILCYTDGELERAIGSGE